MLAAEAVTSSCDQHPELELARLGELNQIFLYAIELVQSIATNMRGEPAKQAASLRQSWLDHWLPYKELADKAPEIKASDVIDGGAHVRVCDLVELTENLAEHVYMQDASRRVSVAYGDFIRVLSLVAARVDRERNRSRRGLRMLAIVAAGGAAVGGLAFAMSRG